VDSPRLDSYRYSLINLEESLENDLDAILGELCALETSFNREAQLARQQDERAEKVGGERRIRHASAVKNFPEFQSGFLDSEHL